MLGTHERIVQSRGSMRPLTQSNKQELIASQLAPLRCRGHFQGQALYDAAVFTVH